MLLYTGYKNGYGLRTFYAQNVLVLSLNNKLRIYHRVGLYETAFYGKVIIMEDKHYYVII